MNRVWNQRRGGQRWKMLIKKVSKAPLGTPVTQKMHGMNVTLTVRPIDD